MSYDDFELETEIEGESELEFDTEIDFYKDFDLYLDIDSDLDLDGNVATLTFDVLATVSHGTADSLAEADVFVLAVEDTLSQVGGSMVAAVE